jgi:hypothetical protein
MGDEVAIEVAHSKEGSDILYLGGSQPFGDPPEFGRVHGYLSMTDNHP